MKSSTPITLLCLIFCTSAHADIPVKKPLQSYSKLWTNSPFTTPPIQTGPVTPDNPLKDYHLTSIAPIEGGYLITIANKKDKGAKKIVIEPGSDSKFQVLKVDRNPDVYLGTVVTLTDGRTQGEVRFEPESVVLNTPTTAKPGDQFPPGFDPNQQNQPNSGQTVPNPSSRPRIVTPTNPGQGSGQNPNQNRGNNAQTRPPRIR